MASIALLNEIAELIGAGRRYDIPSRLGVTALGSGCFSTVYPDPESEFHVIKVGGGDAWANYAAYCIDNPDNEHLPRIQFLKVINGRYVAQIERLTSVGDYQGTPKGPSNKMISDWCMTLGFMSTDDTAWSYVRGVNDHPLYQTMYEINEKIGRTRDLSSHHNMMVRTDGTRVITDPIADEFYKGVNKYDIKRFTYDGYVIPERAHSNERYMVRKEMRYTSPSYRPEAQDRPLQATQSIAVCDARTGQVLGILPQVSGELPVYDRPRVPERVTAIQAAQGRRADMVILDSLKRGDVGNIWKQYLAPGPIPNGFYDGVERQIKAVAIKGGDRR